MFPIAIWFELNKYFNNPFLLGLVCRDLCIRIRNPAYLKVIIINLELCKKSFKNKKYILSKFNTLSSMMHRFDRLVKYDLTYHSSFRHQAILLHSLLRKLEKYIDYNESYNTFTNANINTINYKKFDQLAILVYYEYDNPITNTGCLTKKYNGHGKSTKYSTIHIMVYFLCLPCFICCDH